MKGVVWLEEYFALLLTGILAVGVIPFILPGQVTKISPEIESKEFENKGILLANVLLANTNLMYSDNRAMFDADKLNTNMMGTSMSFDKITDVCYSILRRPPLPTSLCASRSYPESFSLVLVKDTENEKGWFSLIPPDRADVEDKLLTCLESINSEKTKDLFKDGSDISKALNIQDCGFKRISSILNEGFPAAIGYSNGDVHMGWIKVMVIE